MTLFDEQTLAKLGRLSLVAGRVRIGHLKGERRSRKRGSAIEFADYRDYVRGDDLRRLDWNIFARLERPFIKLLEEEEDSAVHILVDGSASMEWPAAWPDLNKLRYALRLAGALGYIALLVGDQLTVTVLHSDDQRTWGPHRGRTSVLTLFEFLEATSATGQTQLTASLRNYALRARRPGLAFVLSDLFSPGGHEAGLHTLLARGYEVVLLQLLSPDELDPPAGGDVKLIDIETGAAAELTLDASSLYLYRRRLSEWQASVASTAARYGVHFLPVVTDLAWDVLVMQTLRQRGILK
jgi:uncharacterized protein (DUF58 family)